MFSSTGVPRSAVSGRTGISCLHVSPNRTLSSPRKTWTKPVPPPTPPMNAPKRSGKRPLLWILLVLLAGGIGYVAMDPDGAMQLIVPYLEERRGNCPPAPRMLPDTTEQYTSPNGPST